MVPFQILIRPALLLIAFAALSTLAVLLGRPRNGAPLASPGDSANAAGQVSAVVRIAVTAAFVAGLAARLWHLGLPVEPGLHEGWIARRAIALSGSAATELPVQWRPMGGDPLTSAVPVMAAAQRIIAAGAPGMRLFSAALSLASAALLGAVAARLVSPRAGWLAAGFMAGSLTELWGARSEPAATVTVALSVLFFWFLTVTLQAAAWPKRLAAAAATGVFAAGAALSSPSAAFLPVVLLVIVARNVVPRAVAERNGRAELSGFRLLLTSAVVAGCLAAVVFLAQGQDGRVFASIDELRAAFGGQFQLDSRSLPLHSERHWPWAQERAAAASRNALLLAARLLAWPAPSCPDDWGPAGEPLLPAVILFLAWSGVFSISAGGRRDSRCWRHSYVVVLWAGLAFAPALLAGAIEYRLFAAAMPALYVLAGAGTVALAEMVERMFSTAAARMRLALAALGAGIVLFSAAAAANAFIRHILPAMNPGASEAALMPAFRTIGPQFRTEVADAWRQRPPGVVDAYQTLQAVAAERQFYPFALRIAAGSDVVLPTARQPEYRHIPVPSSQRFNLIPPADEFDFYLPLREPGGFPSAFILVERASSGTPLARMVRAAYPRATGMTYRIHLPGPCAGGRDAIVTIMLVSYNRLGEAWKTRYGAGGGLQGIP